MLFALSLLAPYVAYFLAEHAGASGVLAVVIAGFVASWRLHYIAPESRVELYTSWDQLSFLLNAVMFLFVGLEAPHRLDAGDRDGAGNRRHRALDQRGGDPGAHRLDLPRRLPAALALAAAAPARGRLSRRSRRDPRGLVRRARRGLAGGGARRCPALLTDGTPFPGRAEIIACTLVVILVTLIGQGVTLLPLVRRLGLSDADPTDAEVRRAREAMLSAGIARLDAFCSEQSCPIAVHRLREAMSDQLAALQSEDAAMQSQALQRLAVASDVRRAVYRAQTDALLALRDQGAINDRVHQELQLELDRANADLREG